MAKVSLIIFFLLISTSSYSQYFLREPYIQNLTKDTAAIIWRSAASEKFSFELQTGSETRKYRENSPSNDHNLLIRRLSSGTTYRYSLKTFAGETVFKSFFKTAPLLYEQRTLYFSVVGDSGLNNINQLKIAQRLEATKANFVLHTGDIVYPEGSPEDYDTKFFPFYKTFLHRIPIYPCVGNHDAANIEGFASIFIPPYKKSASGTKRYYSFNYGFLHFTVIDTNLPYQPESDQYKWLEKDLQKNSRRNSIKKIVFFHHPVFSAGKHGDTLSVQKYLLPLFEKYNVDLVLSGHEHAYERSFSLNLSGINKHKVLYIVTGGGGAPLYDQQNENPSIEKYVKDYHFVNFTATKRKIKAKAINGEGLMVDEFSLD